MLWFAAWTGIVVAVAGSVLVAKPSQRLRVPTRGAAAIVVAAGAALTAFALTLPARERRSDRADNELHRLMPVYQFAERHTKTIAADPAVVMSATRKVTADDIRLFRVLTWIRRGGRDLPEGILNAGRDTPILDVATRGGFVWLHQSSEELVIGTIIARPPGSTDTLSPDLFRRSLPPGWTLAAMNFVVRPDTGGAGHSFVTTETRVYANSSAARRRFAAYWRLIYPGSSLIRYGWLAAIERRSRSMSS
jgi:hypothetical protein